MSEITISQSSGEAETLKALVEVKIKAALEKPKPEITTLPIWWSIWAYGLFLVPAPNNPLTPQKMVKVGDTFYMATIVWFNPAGGATSPANLVTNLGVGIEIQYRTGNLDAWTLGPAAMNVVNIVPFIPGMPWYVNLLGVTAQYGWEACYEMNISARVLGAGAGATPLAGFATPIMDIDSDTFYPTPAGPAGVSPRWEYDIPFRFMIYP